MSTGGVELEARLIEGMTSKRDEIISNAKKRAGEIVKDAEEEAHRIAAEAKEKAFKILESELRAVRDRIIGKAELKGRKTLADSRESAISDVFKEVERSVVNIVEGKDKSVDYGDTLVGLIREAALSIGEKELIVAANDRDGKQLLSNLGGVKEEISKSLGYDVDLRIEKEPLDCLGGVIVCDSLRKKVFYNTLEGRLLKFRRMLEADVAKILSGG